MRPVRIGLTLSAALAATLALSGPVAVAQTQQPPPPPGDIIDIPPPEPVPPAVRAAKPPPPEPDEAARSDTPPPKAAAPVSPTKRPKQTAAILQALDKVTAETLRFEAAINQPVRYKDLVFTVHACEQSAPDEAQKGAYANLEIDSQPRPPPGQTAPPARQLFQGWMFSDAPGVHPFEHPVYDAWLIACKTAAPGS